MLVVDECRLVEARGTASSLRQAKNVSGKAKVGFRTAGIHFRVLGLTTGGVWERVAGQIVVG